MSRLEIVRGASELWGIIPSVAIVIVSIAHFFGITVDAFPSLPGGGFDGNKGSHWAAGRPVPIIRNKIQNPKFC